MQIWNDHIDNVDKILELLLLHILYNIYCEFANDTAIWAFSFFGMAQTYTRMVTMIPSLLFQKEFKRLENCFRITLTPGHFT